MRGRTLLCCGLLGLFTSAQAESYFCPNTYKYINTGQTAVEVLAACGEPASKDEKQEAITTLVPVQQYYYQSTVGPSGTAGGTKIDIVITVQDNKIKTITQSGQEVMSTSLCASGEVIRQGAPALSALSACGDPLTVNETTIRVPSNKISKLDTWVYDFGQYKPRITLKFVNGILQEIQR